MAIRVMYNVLVAFVSKEGGGTHFGFVHRHLITGSRERATFPKCAIWPEIAQAQPVLTTLFDKSFLQSLSVDESVWKGDRTPFPTLPSLSAVGDLREEVKFAKDSLLEGTGFELPVPRDSVRAEPISSQAASMLRYMTIRRTRGIDVVLDFARAGRAAGDRQAG